MNKAIAVITKCPNSVLPVHSIKIRTLPFVLGGLGIKSAMNTSQDAYIASTQYSFNYLGWRNPYYWDLCQPKNDEYVKLYFDLVDPSSGTDYQEIDDTLHATEIKDEDVIQDLIVSQQELWKRRMYRLQSELLRDKDLPNAIKAWTLSLAAEGCTSWFFSAVQTSPQLQIPSDDYLENIRLRLGLPIVEMDKLWTLMCFCDNTHLDGFDQEFHALCCRVASEYRMARHDRVQYLLIQYLKRIFPTCEIIKYKRIQDEEELNAGEPEQPRKISDFQLTVDGKKYFIDIAIVNPSSPSYMSKSPSSTTTPLVAALTEEIRKKRRYDLLEHPENFRFIPFVIEATGRLGTQATDFIEEMSDLRKEAFNLPDDNLANIRRYFLRAVNATIIKGNAQIIRKFRTQVVPPIFPEGSVHWPALDSTSSPLPLAAPVIRSPLHSRLPINPLPSNSQQNRDASDLFIAELPNDFPISESEED